MRWLKLRITKILNNNKNTMLDILDHHNHLNNNSFLLEFNSNKYYFKPNQVIEWLLNQFFIQKIKYSLKKKHNDCFTDIKNDIFETQLYNSSGEVENDCDKRTSLWYKVDQIIYEKIEQIVEESNLNDHISSFIDSEEHICLIDEYNDNLLKYDDYKTDNIQNIISQFDKELYKITFNHYPCDFWDDNTDIYDSLLVNKIWIVEKYIQDVVDSYCDDTIWKLIREEWLFGLMRAAQKEMYSEFANLIDTELISE